MEKPKKFLTNSKLVEFKSAVSTSEIVFSGSYARLLKAVTGLQVKTDIAPEILSVLRGDHFFQGVHRVCVACRVGLGNELETLSSAQVGDSGDNLLQKGYRCFLNKNSSLFDCNPNSVRVFSDIDGVLDLFHRDGLAAPRSLEYISRSGFRSGIALPIFFDGVQRGFVFLNSREPDAFVEIQEEDFILFSAIGTKAAASAALAPSWSPELEAWDRAQGLHWSPNFFSEELFFHCLDTVFKQESRPLCDLFVFADATERKALFCQLPLYFALATFFEAQGATKQKMAVKCLEQNPSRVETVSILIEPGLKSIPFAKCLARLVTPLQALRVQYEILDNSLLLNFRGDWCERFATHTYTSMPSEIRYADSLDVDSKNSG